MERRCMSYINSKIIFIRKLFFPDRKIKTIKWNDDKFKFYIDSKCCIERAYHCSYNEVLTNIWIDEIVEPDSVFYDVGACIGVYSLYAAKRKNCKVFAFEPLYHNFNVLNRNILLNNLDDNINAFCMVIGEVNDVRFIPIYDTNSGTANVTMGRCCLHQGSSMFSLDSLEKFLLFPEYIKIDVEGFEKHVLNGMQWVLRDKRLKSVLVESCNDDTVVDVLFDYGFVLWGVEAEADNVSNYIFVRG